MVNTETDLCCVSVIVGLSFRGFRLRGETGVGHSGELLNKKRAGYFRTQPASCLLSRRLKFVVIKIYRHGPVMICDADPI